MHHIVNLRESSHEKELECLNGYRDTTAYQEGFPPWHLFKSDAYEQAYRDEYHRIHDILYQQLWSIVTPEGMEIVLSRLTCGSEDDCRAENKKNVFYQQKNWWPLEACSYSLECDKQDYS